LFGGKADVFFAWLHLCQQFDKKVIFKEKIYIFFFSKTEIKYRLKAKLVEFLIICLKIRFKLKNL